MSVKIRLARHGRKKRPYYRVVVTDSENKRDGRFIEVVGRFNPVDESAEPILKLERIKHWIDLGANPTDTTAHMIEKQLPGYLSSLELARKERIRSLRAKRKARASARQAA